MTNGLLGQVLFFTASASMQSSAGDLLCFTSVVVMSSSGEDVGTQSTLYLSRCRCLLWAYVYVVPMLTNFARFKGAHLATEEEEEVVEMSESELLKLLDQQEPALQVRSSVPQALRLLASNADLACTRCARDCSTEQWNSMISWRS